MSDQSIERVERALQDLFHQASICLKLIERRDIDAARQEVDRLRNMRGTFSGIANFHSVRHEMGELNEVSIERVMILRSVSEKINQLFEQMQEKWSAFITSLLPDSRGVEYWNLVIDLQIPLVWNWSFDLIIVNTASDTDLQLALISRNQKRVLFWDSSDRALGREHLYSTHDFVYCKDNVNLSKIFASWEAAPPKLLTAIKINEINADTTGEFNQFYNSVEELLEELGSGNATALKFAERWVYNQYNNLEHIMRGKKLPNLLKQLRNRDLIIVSPGPSLKNNIETLRAARGKCKIIAVAQSCPALLRHSIIPDFIIFIDSGDFANVLAGFPCELVGGLIFNTAVDQKFFDFAFKNYYPLPNQALDIGINDTIGENGISLEGGSVSLNAFTLCVSAGARSIALVGQDLSFDKSVYYFRPNGHPLATDGDTEFPRSDFMREKRYKLPGYFGGEVNSKADFWLFHRQLEEIVARMNYSGSIFNCTEGGAYISGFRHIPLAEYISGCSGDDDYGNSCGDDGDGFTREDVSVVIGVLEDKLSLLRVLDSSLVEIISLLRNAETQDDLLRSEFRENKLLNDKLIFDDLHFLLQGAMKKLEFDISGCTGLEENIRFSLEFYCQFRETIHNFKNTILMAKGRLEKN